MSTELSGGLFSVATYACDGRVAIKVVYRVFPVANCGDGYGDGDGNGAVVEVVSRLHVSLAMGVYSLIQCNFTKMIQTLTDNNIITDTDMRNSLLHLA